MLEMLPLTHSRDIILKCFILFKIVFLSWIGVAVLHHIITEAREIIRKKKVSLPFPQLGKLAVLSKPIRWCRSLICHAA
jgi:hypothetical protein